MDEHEADALITQFEQQLKNKESFFFDVDDFAIIIDFYIDSGSVEMAQIALKHATALHPNTVIFQVKKAQILAITNNTEQALTALTNVENLEPFNSDIIRTKANIFSQLQQYDNAIKEYKKLSIEDDAEEIYSNIAFEYENMGQYKQAIQYLKKVLAINPENINALYEIAYCYESTGNLRESISFFQNYLEDAPLSTTAWFNLGISCSTIGRLEDAIEAFDYAIALEPQYASAHFNKATVLCNQGNFSQAIEAYSETLKLENPEAVTLQYIGECYEKTGDNENALEHYFKAIEINENYGDSWAGIASVYYETENYEKALSFIEKAIKTNENNADYLLLQGDIFKSLQEYDMATLAYAKAQEKNPEDPNVWLDLAEALIYRDEDTAIGIETLKNALVLFPDNPSLLYRLSYYELTDGRQKEGYRLLQQALLTNIEGYNEFLEMDETLINDPIIISFIEQAKEIKQKS
ncbi:MAG: tetratricopeptide repeat protein [Bacteroidales bacterium]|nr:tetratricopeptide repeat protein [Bacteroidales bacterium]MCF8327343.1 tetratricopeptide repeat protein [Bacteroidales bacterium]